MTVLRGAFDPAGNLDKLDIEAAFARADDPGFGAAEAGRILAAGRTPLLTVEPWDGDDPRACGPAWGGELARFAPRRIFVRFQHECNGTWYPWSNAPRAHVADWRAWAYWMPANVAKVWCVNVSFPGTKPLAAYWPGAECVDWVAIDGYARAGEQMATLFGPTLKELRNAGILRSGKPLMIAETGAPRGPAQAAFWREGMRWAERTGIAAVCAFDVAKEGTDEDDWRLTPAARRAFLGIRR